METFVGLDVSLGETSVCILDKDGTRFFSRERWRLNRHLSPA